MKKRFLSKKVTLEDVSTEELFTEFMKRVIIKNGNKECFFIDREWETKGFEIHSASNPPLFHTGKVYE